MPHRHDHVVQGWSSTSDWVGVKSRVSNEQVISDAVVSSEEHVAKHVRYGTTRWVGPRTRRKKGAVCAGGGGGWMLLPSSFSWC
jgi:hypothetical protein